MRRQQLILLVSGSALVLVLFFWGNTTPPKTSVISKNESSASSSTAAKILTEARKNLTDDQASRITQLENSVVRGNVKEQQINVFKQLGDYWTDSIHYPEIGTYYYGEEAKLENSEKKLNFAARLMLQHLMAESNPDHQIWLATNAKALYEQSLQINPANDSINIELGACYIFGNISSSPMEGILKIKQVADKDPHNMYAQLILGLGDIRSAQYDKAVERLQTVAQHEPDNLQAIFNLAETYERKGDKVNAILWYRRAQDMISNPSVKREIEERIKTLQ